ncbi:MAG: tripartite-type tricarboxylate transporter receptor subunit TctC [Alphaproteobacteria bacterium]|jgi:tripartite-type tricarboxylate transporter receptor subunit TctC
MKFMRLAAAAAVALLFTGSIGASAADYYAGKSLTLYAGYPPGGGIDNEMRTVARFYANHIPGKPNIIAKNMQGAGGLVLGNYLYTVAKADGLEIGMPGRSGFLLANSIGHKGARYDLTKFTYIGSTASTNAILWLSTRTGINNLDQLKKAKKTIVLGGLSARSQNIVVPKVLAKYHGFPFRPVHGYPGMNAVLLAMERGEVDGLFTHEGSLQSTRPDMIKDKKIVQIFQTFPFEKNVPLMMSFVTDPEEKALLTLLSAPGRVGVPLLGPPKMNAQATQDLRVAHQAMTKDKAFRAYAEKRGIHVSPSTGPELQAYIAANLVRVSDSVVKQYRAYTKRKKKKKKKKE